MAKNKTFCNKNGRVCTLCGLYKTWENFQKYKKHSSGYHHLCKPCKKEKTLEYNSNIKNKNKDLNLIGKICTKCNKYRLYHEYSKKTLTSDGLNCSCKECDKEHSHNNLEKIKEYNRTRIINLEECKICSKCKVNKQKLDFRKRLCDPSGVAPVCRQCKINEERANPQYMIKAGKKSKAKLRQETLDNYNRYCECCGMTDENLLCLDHIYNDGAKERAELGSDINRNLRKNNFPKGRHRFLCYNCNNSRGHYGYCPHKPDEVDLGHIHFTVKDKKRQYRFAKIRKIVLWFFNCKCALCSENRQEFLTFDHINGGGCQHRIRENYRSFGLWFINNNLPDGFRVLCNNCNCSLGKETSKKGIKFDPQTLLPTCKYGVI